MDKTITFGDILYLLGEEDVQIQLIGPDNDALTGDSSSELWEYLRDLPVESLNIRKAPSLALEVRVDDID